MKYPRYDCPSLAVNAYRGALLEYSALVPRPDVAGNPAT
jgi:hypothetical protein